MRYPMLLPLFLAAFAASCELSGDDVAGSGSLTAVDATFLVTEIDHQFVPFTESFVDPTLGVCEKITTGGHLTLFADGRYTMRLDEVSDVCEGGERSGGWFGPVGRYVRAGETITFTIGNAARPPLVGTYSPDGGGSISGDGFPGPTPIPAITIELGGKSYKLTQESQELGNWP